MNNIIKSILTLVVASCSLLCFSQSGAIRINQLGYYPEANKVALVVFSKATTFEVVDVQNNTVELTGNLSPNIFWKDAGDSIRKCDFSSLTRPGTYKIRIPGFGESYPFEISSTILRPVAYASLKSFYYQRSSFELTAPYAGLWARPAGHPDTQCILHPSTGKTGSLSSPGGWYDAGDYGKYVINAGISVATLLSFYENFNTFFADGTIHIPESGNGKNDLLDEVKIELDWLMTMQDEDGGVFFKVTTLGFPGLVMPATDKAERYVVGKSTTSALDFAAMMAMAGRIYEEYDADYAADCIQRAKNAWTWAIAHPAIYFQNPADVSTGEYGDGNAADEFLWAAAELYITTQEDEYKTYLESKSSSLAYRSAPGWQNVQSLASLSLATRPNGLSASLLTTIKNSLVTTADAWLSQINANVGRIPNVGYYWGSNSGIANQGVGLLYAYIVSNEPKYIKGAAECADYLLGKNATGFSFVTGYGSKTPMFIHHRPSHADGVTQPIPGFVAGGPNAGKEDNEKYPFSAPAKSFVDVVGSYASNEVCINWNAPMTALLAGVDAILGDQSAVAFEVQTSVNNPPVISISSPLFDSKTGADMVLKARNTATDIDGITKVEYYIDSRFAAVDSLSPFECPLDDLDFGIHTISVLAVDHKGLASEKTNRFSIYPVMAIPGKVEAEHYSNMTGITTQNTSDSGGGLNVNGVEASDWMDYSLNVEQAGNYVVEFRVAGPTAGGQLELRKSTGLSLATLKVPQSGVQKWVTLSDTIQLTKGKQTLRLYSLVGGWTINWLNFGLVIPTSNKKPFTVSNANSLSVSPNPVSNNFTVNYEITELSPLTFTLFDGKGRKLITREIKDISSTSGKFNWIANNPLAPGSYHIIMQQKGKKVASYRLIKAP